MSVGIISYSTHPPNTPVAFSLNAVRPFMAMLWSYPWFLPTPVLTPPLSPDRWVLSRPVSSFRLGQSQCLLCFAVFSAVITWAHKYILLPTSRRIAVYISVANRRRLISVKPAQIWWLYFRVGSFCSAGDFHLVAI